MMRLHPDLPTALEKTAYMLENFEGGPIVGSLQEWAELMRRASDKIHTLEAEVNYLEKELNQITDELEKP